MSPRPNEIDRAFRRVSVLKMIIAKERQRAEAQPAAPRNVEMGFVERDLPTAKARQQLNEIFNELQLLLDHLHISHMAASFELEARPRLNQHLGDAKSAIELDRYPKDAWPTKLLRTASSFEGLHDLGEVLGLGSDDRESFSKVRRGRNKFSHGVTLDDLPTIDAPKALTLLSGMLSLLG